MISIRNQLGTIMRLSVRISLQIELTSHISGQRIVLGPGLTPRKLTVRIEGKPGVQGLLIGFSPSSPQVPVRQSIMERGSLMEIQIWREMS